MSGTFFRASIALQCPGLLTAPVAFYASRDDLFAPIAELIPVSVTSGLPSGADDPHDHDHDGVTE